MMNRRNFLIALPLLVLPAAATFGGEDWPLPYAYATDGCGPDDGPMLYLTFTEKPITGGRFSFPYLELRMRGHLNSITGNAYQVGATEFPLFSAQYWSGPRVWKPIQNATVQITRHDAAKFVIGLIEADLGDRVHRAKDLTGTIHPNQTPCG